MMEVPFNGDWRSVADPGGQPQGLEAEKNRNVTAQSLAGLAVPKVVSGPA